jgi:hypothetical protein
MRPDQHTERIVSIAHPGMDYPRAQKDVEGAQAARASEQKGISSRLPYTLKASNETKREHQRTLLYTSEAELTRGQAMHQIIPTRRPWEYFGRGSERHVLRTHKTT